MAPRPYRAAQGKIQSLDPIWAEIRQEAGNAMAAEPALGSFIYATVLSHDKLEEAICHRLAQRLNHTDVDAGLIAQTFQLVLEKRARDWAPSCAPTSPPSTTAIRPASAISIRCSTSRASMRSSRTASRTSLWKAGRRDFALYLQSQSSRMFGVDIHPAARFGKGIMLDHATGLVVGETAVVGDNCSFLHAVTLGGSGKETGDRHPKIGDNVMIGAGAKILGNIKVGHCSRIAAGCVVLADVPPNVTVAGVPARVVGSAGCPEPARSMEQTWVDDFGGL